MENSTLPFLILSILFFVACSNNTDATIEADEDATTDQVITYDSISAKEYGADQYGMKKYVFAFLKKGPNRDMDSLEAQKLQMAHMANIGKMAEAGKLVLAGPFYGDEDSDLRGIYIFNVETLEEAEALTNTDPAIQAGSLEMELMQWYGSAGLMAVNEIHGTLQKQGIIE